MLSLGSGAGAVPLEEPGATWSRFSCLLLADAAKNDARPAQALPAAMAPWSPLHTCHSCCTFSDVRTAMLENALGVCMISVALRMARNSAHVLSHSSVLTARFEWWSHCEMGAGRVSSRARASLLVCGVLSPA